MEGASIFALSSRFEGFPLVLLEAMSKGMAVVAFDCPTGPADIIDDHRNGILVPPRDVDAFADGLTRDDRTTRSCAAAAARRPSRRRAATRWTQIGPSWDELLEELQAARAARTARSAGRGQRAARPSARGASPRGR